MRIWEGLGNQLFQYACIRALQLRNHEAVRLCVLPDQGDRTVRCYGLDKLMITIPRAKVFEKFALCLERSRMIKNVFQSIAEKSDSVGYIEEKSVRYKGYLKHLHGNYYLSGWFQNEKYFSDFAEVIRKEIRPRKKIKISGELREILRNKNTVSVHIRRGDFSRFNNILDLEYYRRAFAIVEGQLADVFYVVFSDDLTWVMENMHFKDNVYYVNKNKKLEDYEELFIMSRCKHHIIANSTFSWWGAWLDRNESKIVIGPKQWFARKKLNIMPDTWIRV